MNSAVRILLAERHTLVREGVRRLLEVEDGLRVVGEAAGGVDTIQLAVQLEPDLLLLDWVMPRVSGVALVRELTTVALTTRILLVTASIEKQEMQCAIELGVRGAVLWESSVAMLIRAIRSVMAGQYWVDRESLASLLGAQRGISEAASASRQRRDFGLTTREFDIIAAVTAAYSNKEIAQRFAISEKTVKHHLTNIFDKVGVSSRLELALFALDHHLQLTDLAEPSDPA